MKKMTMQKALVSGGAAIGILGFASPAAFAWSGNNGNYNSESYGSYGEESNSNRCYSSDWSNNSQWNNMGYGDQQNGCKPMYLESSYYRSSYSNQYSNSYGSNCGKSQGQYGAYETAYNW